VLNKMDTTYGVKPTTFINESGLYSLILSCWMKVHLGYRSGRLPKTGSLFLEGNRRCMMSIYIPNLWLNLWYRGEKCTFLHTWKIWIATKCRKIKGRQNQHLGAPKQALLHHESALFLLKNVVFWGSFKMPHNQQREILWHHF
jgi:hypothetical protein